MNSVALPASATAPTLSAEGELIRLAARGEAEPFAELFRRHGQMTWRLAQAVAFDRDSAVAAVSNGFGRALRGARRHQLDGDVGFRAVLLSAVYRCAMEDARDRGASGAPRVAVAAPAPTRAGKAARARSKSTDTVVVEAAFRSLPERWRAALWLSEVESLTTDRVAPILGVSAAVATQLQARGARALAGRFLQAHRPVPDHLGPALRLIGLAMPANLAEEVALRWKSASSDPAARFAPITSWLGERAVRPLWVSAGALLGLGLIGLGLVGQHSTVSTGPATVATSPATGTVPGVNSQSGFGPLGGTTFGGGGAPTNAFATAATATATTAAPAAAAAGAPSAVATPASGTGTPATSGTGTPTTAPSGTPASSQPASGSSTTTPPATSSTAPASKVVVNAAPVATVTQSAGSTTVGLLPTTSGTSTVSATVGCSSGVGLTIGTLQVGCASPAATTPAKSTPASTAVNTVVSGLTNAISKL
jgi:DNA-directed RNA polymerase specialized sigma24 family protein